MAFAPTGASAQGVYFQGPGFGVGIGNPGWYGERHYYAYDYDRPYVRSYPVRPYVEHRTYRIYRHHDWD